MNAVGRLFRQRCGPAGVGRLRKLCGVLTAMNLLLPLQHSGCAGGLRPDLRGQPAPASSNARGLLN